MSLVTFLRKTLGRFVGLGSPSVNGDKIMRVFSFANTHPVEVALTDDSPAGNKVGFSPTIPDAGYWFVGDFVFDTSGNVLGWQCISEGDSLPGNWSAIPNGRWKDSIIYFLNFNGEIRVDSGGLVDSIVKEEVGRFTVNFKPGTFSTAFDYAAVASSNIASVVVNVEHMSADSVEISTVDVVSGAKVAANVNLFVKGR